MKNATPIVVSIGAIALAGAAILAAQQVRPGEVTKPSVIVENRGAGEAIPTTIESMGESASPLRVEVIGTHTVALVPSATVQARFARQPWEHRVLTIPAGQDIAAELAKLEDENWEAVGFQAVSQGAIVLLKRPK
jgi:hypothetical protein